MGSSPTPSSLSAENAIQTRMARRVSAWRLRRQYRATVLAERPGPLAVDHHACCALRIDRRLGTLRGPLQEAALPLAVSRFAARRDINMGSASLAGCSILICEDEPLIALGIADAFTNAGARVLTVRSLADALTAVEDEVPSAAILDHALSDRESSQLCGPLPVDHTLDRLGIVRAAPLIEEDGGERGRRDKLPKLRGQPRRAQRSLAGPGRWARS